MSTIGNAIATRDSSPAGMVEKYKADLATMLPSHVDANRWVRGVIATLRRDPRLMQAAKNDTNRLMVEVTKAARLGLEVGTDEFYLTPRKETDKKTGKKVEKILGIAGYQGLIELMYRAGAVASVIAEVVYSNDIFRYAPGREDRPVHEIDWDAEDRGTLRLAYAYAVMKDGATSKVIVLNRHDITRIKKSSQGSEGQYSPWQTNEAAMWLKSACRQLAKWVPTSAEYRREQLRAAQEVAAEMDMHKGAAVFQMQPDDLAEGEYVDEVTGEIMTAPGPDAEPADTQDAEVLEDGQMFPKGQGR